jgi:aminoglycoside phosphotransferase (APT) family kinase protein
MTGRVTDTRAGLLRRAVAGCDLFGLPDPLESLQGMLQETISGSQSTIHGDLNLENILIGPGGMLWLIDFASTRDGHTLLDFAHIAAQITAHILAPRISSPAEYSRMLEDPAISPYAEWHALLQASGEMAQKCLFNPAEPGEYRRALGLACLGALKHVNLNEHIRHCLYLTAAHTLRDLGQRPSGAGSVPSGAVEDSSASASAST